MPILHTSEIDELVSILNNNGLDFSNSEFVKRFLPINLQYESEVDQDLSRYSEEYYNQQVNLYREISGRESNQQDGELHPVDIKSLVGAANPTGVTDVTHAGEHVRSL